MKQNKQTITSREIKASELGAGMEAIFLTANFTVTHVSEPSIGGFIKIQTSMGSFNRHRDDLVTIIERLK